MKNIYLRIISSIFAIWFMIGICVYLIIKTKKSPTEKIDYTISISKGIVTVRNVDNNEVIGRNVLDSLSVIIINDNK